MACCAALLPRTHTHTHTPSSAPLCRRRLPSSPTCCAPALSSNETACSYTTQRLWWTEIVSLLIVPPMAVLGSTFYMWLLVPIKWGLVGRVSQERMDKGEQQPRGQQGTQFFWGGGAGIVQGAGSRQQVWLLGLLLCAQG